MQAAQILWDYLKLGQPLAVCDCVIALGSHDLRVAEHAARLVLEGWAPVLVCSGGLGRLTRSMWHEAEARKFARIARQIGVPFERIIIEDQSTNTGQNIQFSRDMLNAKGCIIRRALLVHKPYMERRSLATALKVWPEAEFHVSSPPIAFENYPNEAISREEVINAMVGDFQRILVYPDMGFQVPQEIPQQVREAYQLLVANGFTKQLLQSKNSA